MTIDRSKFGPKGDRILLVEDRSILRRHYEEVLTIEGFDVEAVGSAIEAWEIFQSRPSFDWVISDLRLGQCESIPNGALLLKLVKEKNSASTTVLMSAVVAEGLNKNAALPGVDACIEKNVPQLIHLLKGK